MMDLFDGLVLGAEVVNLEPLFNEVGVKVLDKYQSLIVDSILINRDGIYFAFDELGEYSYPMIDFVPLDVFVLSDIVGGMLIDDFNTPTH